MAKAKTVYSCTECGAQQPKWAGQCPDCNAWNSMVEMVAVATPAKVNPRFSGYAGSA